MATFTGKLYGKMFTAAFNKEIDLDSDAIHATLHTSTYTPDQDADDYFNDATNELSTANGYTAGGQALASKTVTYTAGTNKWVFDAADVVWSSSTLTWRTAVLHDRATGADSTRPLILYQQGDADTISTNADTTLQWHASGIIEITVA